MTTGPSTTAAVVASTLLLLEGDPALAPLADQRSAPAVEAAVRRALPLFGHLIDRVPWPLLTRAAHVAERLVSPGFVAHYALRKYAIRRSLSQAVACGHRQVVLVGAGFDMMAESIPAEVSVIEVDHPVTQGLRRDAGQRPVTYAAVDLASEDLDAALRRTTFDPAVDTVFVAEGLLMYLARERVESLLASIARGSGARTVILSSVTPDPEGRVRLHSQRKVVDWIMRWIDEPFVWGEPAEELVLTLARHGFEVTEVTSTMALRDELIPARARRRLPRAPGEIVVVATRSRALGS